MGTLFVSGTSIHFDCGQITDSSCSFPVAFYEGGQCWSTRDYGRDKGSLLGSYSSYDGKIAIGNAQGYSYWDGQVLQCTGGSVIRLRDGVELATYSGDTEGACAAVLYAVSEELLDARFSGTSGSSSTSSSSGTSGGMDSLRSGLVRPYWFKGNALLFSVWPWVLRLIPLLQLPLLLGLYFTFMEDQDKSFVTQVIHFLPFILAVLVVWRLVRRAYEKSFVFFHKPAPYMTYWRHMARLSLIISIISCLSLGICLAMTVPELGLILFPLIRLTEALAVLVIFVDSLCWIRCKRRDRRHAKHIC